MVPKKEPESMDHTRLITYLSVCFAFVSGIVKASEGNLLVKLQTNKSYYLTFLVLSIGAYAWTRPLGRHPGTGRQATTSIQTIFVLWLLSATFYHLPPTFYHLLGFDARSQLSLLIVVFVSTLPVLSLVLTIVSWISWLTTLTLKRKSTLDTILLLLINSFAISLSTSSYYALCGNEQQNAIQSMKHYICLTPIAADSFPNFASFMLYGETPAAAAVVTSTHPSSNDSPNSSSQPIISPVLTVWITLVLLQFFNIICEAASKASIPISQNSQAGNMEASHQRISASRRMRGSRRDQEASTSTSSHTKIKRPIQKPPRALPSLSSLSSSTPFIDKVAHAVESIESTAVKLGLLPLSKDEEVPPAETGFLPMVKWFSGTNSDLLHTVIDLLISTNLLGSRFDYRTLQASTRQVDQPPQDGDGFTFEYLENKEEGVWVDFIADTGDGGDATYNVARHLAAPHASVVLPMPNDDDEPLPPGISPLSPSSLSQLHEAASASIKPHTAGNEGKMEITLPRAQLLLIGGDLVYPNPTRSAYESRLFHPFSSAFPPPPHYHPSRIPCLKPDLSGKGSIHQHQGPACFAIPGNHDWIDGLVAFSDLFMNRGWLGGWCLPQEKSWFALQLPFKWWIFGLDLALNNDLDLGQFRYFADIAEKRLEPDSQVIVMTHQPLWLLDAYWEEKSGQNLRSLIRGHLRGRARVHLAGDLHFYMRHSRDANPATVTQPSQPDPSKPRPQPSDHSQPEPSQDPTQTISHVQAQPEDQGQIKVDPPHGTSSTLADPPPSTLKTPGEVTWVPSRPPLPPGGIQRSIKGMSTCHEALGVKDQDLRVVQGVSEDGSVPIDEESFLAGESPETRTSQLEGSFFCGDSLVGSSQDDYEYLGGLTSGCSPPQSSSYLAAAAAIGGRSPKSRRTRPSSRARGLSPPSLRARGSSPPRLTLGLPSHPHLTSLILQDIDKTKGSLTIEKARGGEGARVDQGSCPMLQASRNDPDHLIVNGAGGAFLHPTHMFSHYSFEPVEDSAAEATAAFYCNIQGCHCKKGKGKDKTSDPPLETIRAPYSCQASFPSPLHSHQLGKTNLRMFRQTNTAFDIIGGGLYFLIISSLIPRCGQLETVLEAETAIDAARALTRAFLRAFVEVFSQSYVSLFTTLFLFLVALGLAKAGGVGSRSNPPLPPPPPPPPPPSSAVVKTPTLALQSLVRCGGLRTQAIFAALHCLCHVSIALSLMVVLELGVETCVRYEGLGREGSNSLYKWYLSSVEQHFPDPFRLKQKLEEYTLGFYPWVLQVVFAVYDVPEAIAVGRAAMCGEGGEGAELGRFQMIFYYLGMGCFFWMLATPVVGLVFGSYLYLSSTIFGVHFDESFSSLRIPDYKAITRMHVRSDGDLEIYTFALPPVPTRGWKEDPRWGRPGHPSKWIPISKGSNQESLHLIDFVLVKRA